MPSKSSTVTVWRSGKLAAPAPAPRHQLGLEVMVCAALLAMAAVVFAFYVAVLERAVTRGELAHQAQRLGRAAAVPCESDPDALRRGECLTNDDGAGVAVSMR